MRKSVLALMAIASIATLSPASAQSRAERFVRDGFALVGSLTKAVKQDLQALLAPPPGEAAPLTGVYELRGPDSVINSYCILATQLVVEVSPNLGHFAHLSNIVTSDTDSVCELGVMANERVFRLARMEDESGSRVYMGVRNVGFQTINVRIQDNSTRTARDARPLLEVTETIVRPSLDDVETLEVQSSANGTRTRRR
jgi:hypothetical protein